MYDLSLIWHHNKSNLNVKGEQFNITFSMRDEQVLKSVVSFLQQDGQRVCQSSDHMRIGTFGNFDVTLYRDALVVGDKVVTMSHKLYKDQFVEACKRFIDET